jgi:hypothetical protein
MVRPDPLAQRRSQAGAQVLVVDQRWATTGKRDLGTLILGHPVGVRDAVANSLDPVDQSLPYAR